MTYTRKTWVTETILDADLNNMENGIDLVHNLATTLAGIKTLTANPIVQKIDAGIQLNDTDAGGKHWNVRSIDGKLEVFDVGGAAVVMTDILTHPHTGGIAGPQIDHLLGLSGVTPDQHHTQIHTRIGADHTGLEDPLNVDDSSPSVAAMKTTADPFPGDVESLALNIQEELHRVRFQLDQVIGLTDWFEDPAIALEALKAHAVRHHSGGADALSVPSIGGAENYLLVDGTRVMTGSIRPNVNNTLDLGSSALGWRDLFIRRNLVHGTVTVIDTNRDLVGLAQVAQNLDPNAADTFDLGDATLTWRDLFLSRNLQLGADVVLSRGAANRLDLASGDNFNLVAGDILLAVGRLVDGVDISELTAKSLYIQANFDSLFGSPTISNQNQYPILLVAAAGEEGFRSSFALPEDWDVGTSITFVVSWMESGGSGVNNVRWKLSFRPRGDLESGTGGLTTVEVTDGASGAINTMHTIAFAAQSGSLFTDNDIVAVQLTRDGDDAADTYLIDVGLIGLKIEYTAG